MMPLRLTSFTRIILALLPLMIIGCQVGIGSQLAPTLHPPPAPTLPASPPTSATDHNSKLIDGYLHVRYIPPCELRSAPAEWVAPIALTDLRSGSVIHLNRDGTLKNKPKPDYNTEEGKVALEAALKDGSLVKQIIARPACPEKVNNPIVRQQNGWPDAYAEDIGSPPMPKVAMGTMPMSIKGPPRTVYPGWRGAYCWQMSGGSRECEDTANWRGFGAASALEAGSGTRVYVAVLGDDANPGVVRRVRVFPAQVRRAMRGRGPTLGEEVHRAVATRGETLEKFVMPNLPGGDYIMIADYESPLGKVKYGFKVKVPTKRTN